MTLTINKELIFEHLAGKTTPLQKRLIEQWLQHEQNRESFYQWLVEWECQSPSYLPDLEQPLEDYINHMQFNRKLDYSTLSNESVGSGRSIRFPVMWRWVSIAAVLLLVALSGWFSYDRIYYQTHRTGFGETRSLTLSDGSKVTLNANSELQVPRFGFGDRTREVVLHGEAFFSVTHKSTNQKFLVKTREHFNITVLGTEFTVYTRKRGGKVMLRTGEVQLNYTENKDQKQVKLKPGDLAILNRQSQLQVRSNVEPEKYMAFKEHRFVFDDTTLREFGQILSENYGLRVEISSDQLADRTIVGSFHAENADELLNIISELFNIQVIRQDNSVRLIEDN